MKFASAFVLLASAMAVCAAPVEEARAIANSYESLNTYYGGSVERSVVENAIAENDVADPDGFFLIYRDVKPVERVERALADDVIVAARAVAGPDEILARD
ncbi:hypothetical protein F5050DRAFT_1791866 [Lentinula boryana]|uniref:Uncharacterized protein n=1 Tax=Lentinula boryana TaxID=40481 RepID=A0ABQ8Q0H6_9AGAR|nr:hypothetical protein F5050DRAFT_1791866 [Lentinula boryana]